MRPFAVEAGDRGFVVFLREGEDAGVELGPEVEIRAGFHVEAHRPDGLGAVGIDHPHVAEGECGLRVGQDAPHVIARKRIQLDTDGQPALQFGEQVGRLGNVERA